MSRRPSEGILQTPGPMVWPRSVRSYSGHFLTIFFIGACGLATMQTGIALAQGISLPDLTPTPITVNDTNHPGSGPPLQIGSTVHFDSGIANLGDTGTQVFNVKWLVDGQDVTPPAYGSHAGIPAHTTVPNGNSQFDWIPTTPGAHTITFIVDVDNHVAESNESNNVTSVKVTAAPTQEIASSLI
jgi:hypothetical protein